jgi:hypothetical protein
LYSELVADDNLWMIMAKVHDFITPELSDEEKQRVIAKKYPYYGLFTGAVLMRKTLFDRVGFFDEILSAGEIISLLTNMDKQNLRYKKINFVACNRRIHATNFGRTDINKEYKDYSKILRTKLCVK